MSKKDEPNLESKFVSLRLEAGLTQKAIADALGVTEQTVRNWERGKIEARLTLGQTKLLCKMLNKSLDEMPDNFAGT
ncbi:helix-turn-helix transcriptional regulator [Pseudanabaena sp. FACHB-2040]|uniref:helix-turn-helix transcriptional regulator n=1 Tax=Pseudanabaena sp. FACHB-2040 TaxID=2692859 RepID=UPI001683E13C|nr:helix-turn-helix transcriptional regulator [Pseudanabaena sp. FACHB-2040]MBD2259900.1 helix-turn-helix transcriptional regulator [Pseudanabaena sp. FACHB-2040]